MGDRDKSGDILANIHQVEKYLHERGFQCSYKKIKAAVNRNELVERRGGGWTRRTVDQYARAFLSSPVRDSPELDVPALAPDADFGAAGRKLESQANILDVQAARARIELNERLGRLTRTAVIELELGERAKAFRLGLERFGLEKAEEVAALFGGGRRNAQELARRLGIPEGEEREKAVAVIMDFCMDRSSAFPRFFSGKVDAFLDPYSTDRWWTEDMADAWELYQRHTKEDIPEVAHA